MDELDIKRPVPWVIPDEDMINLEGVGRDVCGVRVFEQRNSLAIRQWCGHAIDLTLDVLEREDVLTFSKNICRSNDPLETIATTISGQDTGS
jgi:hypothetical protein